MKKKRLHMEILTGVLSAVILIAPYTQGQAAWQEDTPETEPTVEISGSTSALEEDIPWWNGGISFREGKRVKVRRPLMAQLNEALSLERQIEVCQDAKERETYLALYEHTLTEALTGGYSQEQDGEEESVVVEEPRMDRHMADYYRDFINANGGSRTAEILKDCCQELEAWDYQPDEREMEAFREKLPSLIGKWSRMEKGSLKYLVWKFTGWAC